MGVYINPGSSGFNETLRSEYVDKSGLICQVNKVIGTSQNRICISRPRRFGKTTAAQMLCAYYDDSCDSHELFNHLEISRNSDYEKHLNHYHVVYLDITGFISEAKVNEQKIADIPLKITNALLKELRVLCPSLSNQTGILEAFTQFVRDSGKKCVFIVDEWDAVFREATKESKADEYYMDLLRKCFNNDFFVREVAAAVYLTGIMPVGMAGSPPSLAGFVEYNMMNPGEYGGYMGFTENEVAGLCSECSMDPQALERWYGGYLVQGVGQVYNPYSIMQAIANNEIDMYWTETSSADRLLRSIALDYTKFSKILSELLDGKAIKVGISENIHEMATSWSVDKALTFLAHLGYLTYDANEGTVRIPNEEIRLDISRIVRKE